jgi:transcriptional regulator with XRE-family HTH domain
MTETQSFSNGTSAAGSMLGRVSGPILVGCMLAGLGTSHGVVIDGTPPRLLDQTTAGREVPNAILAAGALSELRRRSGLTWDQLARLFKVSRRAVHFWASGKPMTKPNEEHLQRVLAVVRRFDRGSAGANRALLVAPLEGTKDPIDLLAEGQYERVAKQLGSGPANRPAARPPKLSREARAARAPRPPAELVGALQDRVGPTSGRLLSSTPIVTSRKK